MSGKNIASFTPALGVGHHSYRNSLTSISDNKEFKDDYHDNISFNSDDNNNINIINDELSSLSLSYGSSIPFDYNSDSEYINTNENSKIMTKFLITQPKMDQYINEYEEEQTNIQNIKLKKVFCSQLLLSGYIRIILNDNDSINVKIPTDLNKVFIMFLDPFLEWCLLKQKPKKILELNKKRNQFELYFEKNDFTQLSISQKYIIRDILCYYGKKNIFNNNTNNNNNININNNSNSNNNFDDNNNTGYNVTFRNDANFGENLNDIEWLCYILNKNTNITNLSMNNIKNITNYSKFFFFCQKSFLYHNYRQYNLLKKIDISNNKKFGHECFKILLNVIIKKLHSLEHLILYKTSISNESIKQLLKYLDENNSHPLWNIDIEFCSKITDIALKDVIKFLKKYNNKRFLIKMTKKYINNNHHKTNSDPDFNDNVLKLSWYP